MIKERDMIVRKVVISLDMIVISLVFFATFIFRRYFPDIYTLDIIPSAQVIKAPLLNVSEYLILYFTMGVLWYSMLSLNGMYRPLYFKVLPELMWRIVRSAVFVTIAFGAIAFLLRMQFVSRVFFAFFMTVTSFSIMLERLVVFSVMRHVIRREYSLKRLLVVGTGKRAIDFIDKVMLHPEWGYELVKVVDFDQIISVGGKNIKGAEIVPKPDDMREVLRRELVDEVFFVVPKSMLDRVETYLFVCEEEGVDAAIAMDFFGTRDACLHHTDLEGTPLLTFEKTFGREWLLFIKRILDVVISGLSIIIFFPLFLLVAFLVKVTSAGPVFFSQEKVGMRRRKFIMREFRVGKLPRRLNIDKLPQLFNVFLGQMSFVGPKPASQEDLDQHKPWQKRQLFMRPGMVCLWQIEHRGKSDFEKQLQSDLQYVDNWSLGLDFKIFMKAIGMSISGKETK